jgi:glycosyltransferase involved in cell wall biosynthesis
MTANSSLIYFNGRFLTQPVTGVQRFALEVLNSLDNYLTEYASFFQGYHFICLVPSESQEKSFPHWKNILIKRSGRLNGNLWEQIELPIIARRGLLISLCNIGSVFHFQQIVTFHDASVFAVPWAYKIAFILKYRFVMWILARTARQVFTVSQFSKTELAKYLGTSIERISIIPEGCEHILQASPDRSIITKHNLSQKPFILTIGSLSPHKNINNVIEAIKNYHTDEINLVIVGGEFGKVFKQVEAQETKQIIRLGYVTDSELRALYENALCLIFPSLYEGFGLPPLEAMSCGCPVLSSNMGSFPEIYRDAALYFDPTNLDEIRKTIQVFMGNAALQKHYRCKGFSLVKQYTWKQAGKALLERIIDYAVYSPPSQAAAPIIGEGL